jgi:hypothetical protein
MVMVMHGPTRAASSVGHTAKCHLVSSMALSSLPPARFPQVWDDHHRFFACSLSKLPAAGTTVETSRPHECGLASPRFTQACHNPRLLSTPQGGAGSHKNVAAASISPAAVRKASCVDYFQQVWPKETIWCQMRTTAPSRRRCTYLTVRGAPCNTSAAQVGCPATAPQPARQSRTRKVEKGT